MKVQIVFPANDNMTRFHLQQKAAPSPPLPLEYLAALAPSDTEIELIDMGQGDEPTCGEADLVAFHVRTPAASTAFQLADKLRARGVKVVMGGPHPTLLPTECREHSDAVCIGEGEEAWPAMLEDLDCGSLRDYYIAGPHRIEQLKGQTRQFPLPTLCNLPFPRRDLFPQGRYKMQGVFVSRGCPYNCNFCSVKNLQGAEVRLRPKEEVLEEISGIDGPIFFAEENATGILQTSKYHRNLFKQMVEMGVNRNWSGGSTLGLAAHKEGKKVLEAAVESGFIFAFIGFETLNAPSAKKAGVLGKLGYSEEENFQIEQLEDLVKIYYNLGVYVMGYFVVGFDEDTEDTFKRIIEFCDRTLVMPMFTMLAPMPGTKLYKEYVRQNRFFERIRWDDFGSDVLTFKHPRFSAPKLRKHYLKLWEEAYTPDRVAARLDFAYKTSPHASNIVDSVQAGVREAFVKKT